MSDANVKIVRVRAPSNIALIKYMGKKDSALNIPENPSISMTLNALCTFAEVSVHENGSGQFQWAPLNGYQVPDLHQSGLEQDGLRNPPLSRGGEQTYEVDTSLPGRISRLQSGVLQKIVAHVARMKTLLPPVYSKYKIRWNPKNWEERDILIKTGNTFPASSGIASSASSFAAMTLALSSAFAEEPREFESSWADHRELRKDLARISRQGSGSSCRSFEGQWVLWEQEDIHVLDCPKMPSLAHFVVLVDTQPKKIPSSRAHALVRTSPLWEGRPERATHRTQKMRVALAAGDLGAVARLAWSDAWEMHSLFHTAQEPFSYWAPATIEALHWLSSFVLSDLPPIVTLDAGPNVHVSVELSMREVWRNRLKEKFGNGLILEDELGGGCRFT